MVKVVKKTHSDKFNKIAPPLENINRSSASARGHSTLEVLQIKTENIRPFKNQPRKLFNEEEIQGLANSIKEVGIISPLLVSKDSEAGIFSLINGERRLRAAKLIGMEKVPCMISNNTDKSEVIALVDNIQRAELHPVEVADAYSLLVNNYGDKKIISQNLGVAYTSFLEILKLHTLPQEIKIHILQNNIKSRAIFRKLLKASNAEEMKLVLGMVGSVGKEKKKKIFEVSVIGKEVIYNLNEKNITQADHASIINALEATLEILRS